MLLKAYKKYGLQAAMAIVNYALTISVNAFLYLWTAAPAAPAAQSSSHIQGEGEILAKPLPPTVLYLNHPSATIA